jgi:RNA polymerase sigma-70 factor (ECF subfamily)
MSMLAVPIAETETTLVVRARQGDRNAFGELVRWHHPGVVQVVYRMCGDTQLAEDATQEAFLRAWQHFDSFRPGSSLRNWLYRIAVNAALDLLRRAQEKPMAPVDSLPDRDPEPGPEAQLIRHEQRRQVQQAVLSLAETSRAVLVLREYGGLSYQEISAALDIPIGTVMSRLNHARLCLREILMPQLMMENEYD